MDKVLMDDLDYKLYKIKRTGSIYRMSMSLLAIVILVLTGYICNTLLITSGFIFFNLCMFIQGVYDYYKNYKSRPKVILMGGAEEDYK